MGTVLGYITFAGAIAGAVFSLAKFIIAVGSAGLPKSTPTSSNQNRRRTIRVPACSLSPACGKRKSNPPHSDPAGTGPTLLGAFDPKVTSDSP
jgi:hypothetical protein